MNIVTPDERLFKPQDTVDLDRSTTAYPFVMAIFETDGAGSDMQHASCSYEYAITLSHPSLTQLKMGQFTMILPVASQLIAQ